MQHHLFLESREIALNPSCQCIWYPNWFHQTDALWQCLTEKIAWSQPSIRIAGQERTIPRMQSWVGEKNKIMSYSGKRFQTQLWPEEIRSVAERVSEQAQLQFNSVLINCYRNGQDSVSWHADDEPELGPKPIIASLSLGATRTFCVKPKDGGATQKISLNHGDLLIMKGNTQHDYQHAILKEPDVAKPRFNLTFRRILS